MIFNERQYNITKKQIRGFELKLAELQNITPPDNRNQKLRHQAHLNALNSQLEDLRIEVEDYENLKKGKMELLEIDSFEKLPEAIIKARIIRGLTQEQLAERLQVKPQQVQRDEANKYASTSFSRMLEILNALNVEVKEQMIFK